MIDRRSHAYAGRPSASDSFPTVAAFVGDMAPTAALRKICLVTNELAELHQNGGIGTANSGLLQELIQHQIDVDILYTSTVDLQSERIREATETITRLGANIIYMQDIVPTSWMWSPRRLSFGCFETLRQRSYDLIHFNDYLGHGFYAGQAKQLGLAFRGIPIVTTVHGPTRWAHQIDERPIASLDQEEICVLEAKAIEYSDVVLGVSNHLLQWLRNQNVVLPPLTFLHKNILPNMGIRKGRGELAPHELTELVFFARQDVRKGFRVFLNAISRIATLHPHIKFTFLGKFSRIEAEHSGALALDALRTASNLIDFRHDLDRERALTYLQKNGVLAVIPSLDENSPCTVFECIEAGIPFIASDVGGIPELIAPEFHDAVLFRPDAAALANHIRRVIGEGIQVPRLAFDVDTIARQQIAFFDAVRLLVRDRDRKRAADCDHKQPLVSICITHYNRSKLLDTLLKAIEKQTYPAIEVVVVDDGSTNADDVAYFEGLSDHRFPLKTIRIENSYLGAARNAAVRLAEGDFVKFQDDDNLPMPHEIETFVSAAVWRDADVVTAFAYFFKTEQDLKKERSYLDVEYFPLGASLPLALFRNEYGDANALVRRSVFDSLGGFSELRGVGCEDYELFGRAEVAGFRVHVIPIPIFNYRISGGSMLQSTSIYANAKRARQAFGARAAVWIDQLMDFAQNVHLNTEIKTVAWYKAGARKSGELHQQLLEGEPNDELSMTRFIELASRYERFEDILHLVIKTNPIVDALRWLEDNTARFNQAAKGKRELLQHRPRIFRLAEIDKVELVEPTTNLPIDFDLTGVGDNGILVHPLTRRETKVLVLRIIPPGTHRITLTCHHAGVQGLPLRMACEIVRIDRILGRSEWVEVMPGGRVDITLDVEDVAQRSDLVLKSTIDGVQNYAWAYAEQVVVEGHFRD